MRFTPIHDILDKFYGNLVRREIHLCHIRRYKREQQFTLEFVLIYVVLVQVLRLNRSEPEPTRAVVCARFSRHNLGPIRHYKTYRHFTLKFVPVYAVLVHVLR
jgi:hypothetical protein